MLLRFAAFVFSPQQNAHTRKTDLFGVPCSLAYLRLLWRGRRSPPSCCLCQLFSKTFSTRPNLQRWPIWSKKKTCTKKRQNCATQKEVKNIKEQTLRDAQTAEEICFLPVSSGHMARCLTILPTAQHNKRLQHPLLHLASSAWFLHNIAYIALWLSYIFFPRIAQHVACRASNSSTATVSTGPAASLMFSSWKERNTFSICLLVLPKHWTYDITKIITFSRIERCTLTFHLIATISEVASGSCWSSVNETAKKAQRSQITARTPRSSLVCNMVQNVTFKKHKINLRVLRLKWPGSDPDSFFCRSSGIFDRMSRSSSGGAAAWWVRTLNKLPIATKIELWFRYDKTPTGVARAKRDNNFRTAGRRSLLDDAKNSVGESVVEKCSRRVL